MKILSEPNSEDNIFSKKGGRKFRRLGHELKVSIKGDIDKSRNDKRLAHAKERALENKSR